MKRAGEYLLKKLKILCYILLILIFSACKSLPTGVNVDPLSLLDEKSSLYLSIPLHVDESLIKEVLSSYMPDLSSKDLNNICNRISKIYIGLNHSRNKSEIQASAQTNIPVKYIPRILSKKNGWEKRPAENIKSQSEYNIFYSDTLDLCFPSDNIAILGRDIDLMASKYDEIFNSSINQDEIIGIENNSSCLNNDLYNFLNDNNEEIRFYANKPQSFLTILTGSSLNLKLIDVKGAFRPDLNSDIHYSLDLDFQFKNTKYLKAGKALLFLAFGLTNSQVYVEDNHLILKNIQISKEQIYKIIKI